MLRVYFLLLDIQKAVPFSKHNQIFWLLARLSLSLCVCVCVVQHTIQQLYQFIQG